MFIVEKDEVLVLRTTQPMCDADMAALKDQAELLEKQTGVRFVFLDYGVEPIAVQKK